MVLVLQIVVSLLVALLGQNRKIGFWWGFVLCLFLSSIVGLIIILCSKKKNTIDFVDVNKSDDE